jgi:hypothetical protein
MGLSTTYFTRSCAENLPFPAAVIGDAVHNIRSALDHLVYELAPPEVRRRRRTQFPIFMTEAGFRNQGLQQIDGITGDERTLIEKVQPYNASDPPNDDPLAVLNRLSNLDKHRLLVPVIAAVSDTGVWVGSDNAEVNFTFIEPGAVEDGTKIVAFTTAPKDPTQPMAVHPQSGLEIQLADTGSTYRSNVVGTLEMLHYHVRRWVMGLWFEHGYMPKTRAEVLAASGSEQSD